MDNNILNQDWLLDYVSRLHNLPKEKFMWSKACRNPLTNYHHEDGTIKGTQGYWVLKE